MSRCVCLLLAALVSAGGCSSQSDRAGKPTVAYVTNGIASFWVIAEKGAKAAGEKFGANVEVRMPPKGVADQKRMVQELLTKGVDGIAISPIDPDNQGDLFKEIRERTKLITHDSDAVDSGRLCYVGMDNYQAGRMCGKLVKRALPDGGSVMIFVGRLGQLNAKQRRQGLIDELLDRSEDRTRFDEPGAELKGDKYVVLDTRTDGFDFAKAKSLAQDAIAKYPDLGCMVGLFAYNPPKCLEAIREADKLGQIQLVAFDEDDETLQGIADGHVFGTIVQNPYEYGYESVRILTALAKGDESALPPNGYLDIPAREITKENVQKFRDDLKALTKPIAKPEPASEPASMY
jgi:ribose transport system substrate-binding protein